MKSVYATGSTKIDISKRYQSKGGHLLRIFSQMGYRITDDPSSDFMIAFDHNAKSYRSFIRSGGNPKKAFLIRLEPPAVYPVQYKRRIEALYSEIFTPGWVDSNTGYVNLGWVYRYDEDPVNPGESPVTILDRVNRLNDELEFFYANWKKRSILLSMVTGNKVSPINEANYALRREIAKQLGTSILQVYGVLWKENLYTKIKHRAGVLKFSLISGHIPSLKNLYGNLFSRYSYTYGQVKNKHEVLGKSKFSIISENSNSYFSEKLFDALIAGTIPLYIGPDLKKSGLPSDVAIQINGKTNQIPKVLREISETEITNILTNGLAFLKSEQFLNFWTEEAVYSRVAEEIKLKLPFVQTP